MINDYVVCGHKVYVNDDTSEDLREMTYYDNIEDELKIQNLREILKNKIKDFQYELNV